MNATSERSHQLRELDSVRTLSYEIKQKYRGKLDQIDGIMLDAAAIFVATCLKLSAEDLEIQRSRTRLLEMWHSGADMLDAFQHWNSTVSSTSIGSFIRDELPTSSVLLDKIEQIFVEVMTHLATRWLLARSENEPRGVLYERIAALRPVEQNKQLQELMEKNNEGTITPKEHAVLARLNEFFDTLQSIIDDAITATRQKAS